MTETKKNAEAKPFPLRSLVFKFTDRPPSSDTGSNLRAAVYPRSHAGYHKLHTVALAVESAGVIKLLPTAVLTLIYL